MAFVIGESADRQDPRALAAPGPLGPGQTGVRRHGQAVRVQPQGDDLAPLAPGSQGQAGVQIGWRGGDDGLAMAQQSLFERAVQLVGQGQAAVDRGRDHIRVPMHHPRQAPGARQRQGGKGRGVGQMQVQ